MSTEVSGRQIAFWAAVRVVATREVMVRLRSKAFVVSTSIFLFGILAVSILGSFGPTIFAGSSTTVAATSQAAAMLDGVDGYDVTVADSEAQVRELVSDGTVDAGVIGAQDGGFTVIAERDVPADVMQVFSIAPKVELLDPNAQNPGLVYLIGLGFGLVFFMSALTYGTTIAQSVVEEKQTRIVEILRAAIPARALLAGKVLGCSLLAFAQVLLTSLIVIGTGAASGSSVMLQGLGPALMWFVLLFTVGFVMLAGLYAAMASLVSRVEDLGSATSPLMMLVMIPYVLVIVFNNNPAVLAVMSYVPFSAPVAVPMRVFLGSTSWWEPLLALAILVVTMVAAIRLAAVIYDRSLLRTGQRVKLAEVLRSAE